MRHHFYLMEVAMRRRLLKGVILGLSLLLLSAPALANERIRLATTTSTQNSGLLEHLIPPFEKASGVTVDVISVGTGKALALAKRCDVDLVMVHAPKLELKFVADGYGVDRRKLMHNYFVVVGPAGDPAGVAKAKDVVQAFKAIAKAKAPFVSRGDKSGTNVKEKAIWKAAGIKPAWDGYKEAGQGMGAVLTMSNQLNAYTLTDIGTYRKYLASGKLDLKVLLDRDPLLKNPYAVILVNPAKCPKTKTGPAKAFMDFLVSPKGQKLIKNYKADGKQMFWPEAMPVKSK
jgi:tungstate transport system substrate-binding protein